jgi:hypothetical protein
VNRITYTIRAGHEGKRIFWSPDRVMKVADRPFTLLAHGGHQVHGPAMRVDVAC